MFSLMKKYPAREEIQLRMNLWVFFGVVEGGLVEGGLAKRVFSLV